MVMQFFQWKQLSQYIVDNSSFWIVGHDLVCEYDVTRGNVFFAWQEKLEFYLFKLLA